MANQHNIHFVGSLGMADAETVFRTLAEIVGDGAKRYTDGEHGGRARWIRYQFNVMERTPGLEVEKDYVPPASGGNPSRPYFMTRDGVEASEIEFGALGYADEAIASFELFSRLKADGTIPSATRFQVSLPTPVAVLWGFIAPEQRVALEPAYEKAMSAEVAKITAAIPADELAIQWDVCQETLAQDGALELYFDDTFDGSVARACRMSALVPEPAELGIHLCYGDPGHKHIQEPVDTGTCVQLASAIVATCPRPVNWIHLPVPRERDDDAYFAPLSDLKLGPETELVLGLVHHTGGVDATTRRMETAHRHVKDFGIATECGFGRRDPETIAELLRIHAAAA